MVTFLCHRRENENKFVVIDVYANISAWRGDLNDPHATDSPDTV